MKKIILFLVIAFLYGGCRKKCGPPTLIHHNLESYQLSFVPYKLGDTLSFVNENTKAILHYKCTKYQITNSSEVDTTECPKNESHCISKTCIADVWESLDVELTCTDSSDYSFTIKISSEDYSNIGMQFLYKIYLTKYYSEDPPIYFCSLLIENYASNNNCGMNSDAIYCLNSFSIGNKSYQNVSKFYDPTAPLTIGMIDTLYYNRPNGVVKFGLVNGKQWNKR